MSRDCTCARTPFGHEPDCSVWLNDLNADYSDYHSELLLDADREDSL